MAEYIVLETGYPGAVKQEVVGELVRCKDCKHNRKDDIFRTRWCQKPGHGKEVKDEFFCANGERKDDE